jgi:hypothetical protein
MVDGGSRHALPLLVVWEAEALMQDSLGSAGTAFGEACSGAPVTSGAERIESAVGGAMYHLRPR